MNEYQKAILKIFMNKYNITLTNTTKNHYELIKGERGTYDEYFDYCINFALDENDEVIKQFDVSISDDKLTYVQIEDEINKIKDFIDARKDKPFYTVLIEFVTK